MQNGIVRFAIRHERLARRVAFAAAIGLALTVGLGAGLTLLSPLALPAVFAFFMGVGVLAWGVTMLASWYRPPPHQSPRYSRGISRFAGRAWKVYAGGFLIVWFAIGCALVATAVVLLTLHLASLL